MSEPIIRPRIVADGIHAFAALTPTLPPATHTNSYALGDRDVVLVEPATPYEDEQREWIEWARSLASLGRRPVAIFATHHHADHISGAGALSEELDLPVWAHSETASRLGAIPVARRLNDGDELILDGPRPQRWVALHTPGHAPGHLCLHEPELDVVVVGDMVASVGTILIEPNDGHMATYLEQLQRLASLGAKTALPAHGDPIDNPTQLFEYYVRHRLAREAKVVDALRASKTATTAEELVPTVYQDVAREAWPLGALSIAAHLLKLADDGVARRTEDGRWTATIAD